MGSRGVALRIRDFSAGYGGKGIVSRLDVDIRAGAITGLIGPNGAGKSTLLKALLGEVRARGRVELHGRPLTDLRRVAYVPQRSGIDLTFPITALGVALQGTYASLRWWQRPGREHRAIAHEALERVGMADHARAAIGELSGGQAARVFLARALAQRPSVYLLDEPLAAIDAVSAGRILEVLREQRDSGDAIVIVHHNLDQVPEHFDDLLVLNRTLVASGPTSEVFTPEVLAEAFPAAHALANLSTGGGGRE